MTDTDRRGAAPSPATLAPEDIATRAFSTSFRGLSESEVRSFLQRVADELARAQARVQVLEHEAEARASAPDDSAPLDESALLEALGEETTKLLRNAREAAKDIRQRAEETAARLRGEATEDAERIRSEAGELLDVRTREADAAAAETRTRAEDEMAERRRDVDAQIEAELEDAKSRGRAMVDEARAVRERMLADLGHRRGLLQAQVAELRAGRDHLLDAYRIVKRSFLEATEALASVEARFAQSRPQPLDEAEIEAALRPDAGEAASAELAESIEADGPELSSDGGVGDLFARIRAESSAPEVDADAPGTSDDADGATDSADIAAGGDSSAADHADTASDAAPAPEPEADPLPVSEPEAPAAVEASPRPGPLERASTALAPVMASGAKRAKRALQDEQNSVLDALRRHKGKPSADDVLPNADEQVATWKTVVGDALARAYIAGRRDVDADQSSTVDVPEDLAATNAAQLLSTLRDRLVVALDDPDGDGAGDRVSARYREWKSQELEPRLEDVVRSAYARGVYDAASDGAELRWVVAEPRCCADCADNALEKVTKGATFPTGQPFPPAHAGCKCVLVVP